MNTSRESTALMAALGLAILLGCAATGRTAGSGGEGKVSMDALQGKTWTLVQFEDGSRAPAERPITAVFQDGKTSGSGGCNRYTATVTSPSPGALKVGPISATKMLCTGPAGANEQRYFAALAKAEGFA